MIYQIEYRLDGGGGWVDVEKDEYDEKLKYPREYRGRIVYTQNTVPDVRQWTRVEDMMPEVNDHVLVSYVPLGSFKPVFIGAVLDKPWADVDRLFWFNDKGEAMRGEVTHWMSMVPITEVSPTTQEAKRWNWIVCQDWLLDAVRSWGAHDFDFIEQFETFIDKEVAKQEGTL